MPPKRRDAGGADRAARSPSKKDLILAAARDLGVDRFSGPEIEKIRRRLIAQLGAEGKTEADYVTSVLEESGQHVVWSAESDTAEQYEEEFTDLLHFSTLEEAEMCLIRLDELLRKFSVERERSAIERVREVARLGRRRAEMIAHNHKVDPRKRAEKVEVARWFGIWLETPDTFFDWLEIRKQSPEFRRDFPTPCDEQL